MASNCNSLCIEGFPTDKGFWILFFFASIIKCEVETCSKWVLKNKSRWCNSPCLGETSLDYTAADERRTKKKTARVENTSATCSFVFRWYIYRWKYFLLTWKNQKNFFFLPSRPVQSPQSGVTKHYKSRYLCVRRYGAMFRVFFTYRKVKVKSL